MCRLSQEPESATLEALCQVLQVLAELLLGDSHPLGELAQREGFLQERALQRLTRRRASMGRCVVHGAAAASGK